MADLRTILQGAVSTGALDDRAVEEGWRRGRAQRRRRRLGSLAAVALVGSVGAFAVATRLDSTDSRVVAGPPTTALAPESATTQEIPAPGVDDVSFGGGLTVRLVAGGGAITVEAAPNVLGDVEVTVDGSRAVVERRSPLERMNEPVVVTLASGPIERLAFVGGVLIEGDLRSDELDLEAAGGVNGSVRGTVQRLNLDANGGVRLDLTSLEVGRLAASLAGGASIDVSAAIIERASLSGGSKLSHQASAQVLQSEVDISSRIERR